MLIPIGHDHGELRRWPILSFVILTICTVLEVMPPGVSSEKLQQADQAFAESFEYYLEHLELEPHPLLRNVATRYAAHLEADERDELRAKIENPPPGSPISELRQESLDKKTNTWVSVLQKQRTWQWGYIPQQSDYARLVTHMFLHGGFMHLFFNMLFLYIMAPFIEDQWGRPLFLVFYIAAGVIAALMFSLHQPDAGIPLVGASGAIAGVMGAFLVRFPKASIKFWRFFPPGTFSARAWIVLPLWFLGELLQARLQSVGMPSGDEMVAYWAHVYGFGFGAGVGLLIWAFRVEEKYVKPAIEAQLYGGSPTLSEVNRLLEKGQRAAACDVLERELSRSPSNVDTALSYWPIAAELGRLPQRSALCQRVIAAVLRGGNDTEALQLWEMFEHGVPQGPIDLLLAVPLSRRLQSSGRRQDAINVIERAVDSIGPDSDPELLVDYGRCAVELSSVAADQVIERIVRHPRVPRAAKQALAPDPAKAFSRMAVS